MPFSYLHGPFARYVKLRVAHVLGMPVTLSPPLRVSDPSIHHGTCVTHVPWCMSGSLTSGSHWSRWWRKRSRHFRRMRNPQFYVPGKRSMKNPTRNALTYWSNQHFQLLYTAAISFWGTLKVTVLYRMSHYGDAIMSMMASLITSLTIVSATVYSGEDQRKHQSTASLAFLRGIHRWPVNYEHKGQ